MRELIKSVAYRSMTALWADQHGYVPLTVRRGPSKGLRFKLDLIKRRESAYWLGKYDAHILAKVGEVIQPGWTCWDCGVYLGLYSCYFARQVGPQGKVISFEPDRNNLARAQDHANFNNLKNITFHNLAIGPPNTELNFVVSDNTNSHLDGVWLGSTREEYQTIERRDGMIKIKCVSPDEAISSYNVPKPDLLKLDIEGAEIHALANMHEIASSVRPVLLLELHNPECDLAAWKFVQKYDYTLYSLDYMRPVETQADTRGTLLCHPR